MRGVRHYAILLMCFYSLAVAGCARLVLSQHNDLRSIAVSVAQDNTINHAIPVDVVFVYDGPMLSQIATITSSAWFANRSGFLAMGDDIDVLQWELVRGSGDIKAQLPERSNNARYIVAFAYTPENPDARVEIGQFTHVQITFVQDQLIATELAH